MQWPCGRFWNLGSYVLFFFLILLFFCNAASPTELNTICFRSKSVYVSNVRTTQLKCFNAFINWKILQTFHFLWYRHKKPSAFIANSCSYESLWVIFALTFVWFYKQSLYGWTSKLVEIKVRNVIGVIYY